MRNLLMTLSVVLSLTGCSFLHVHKMDIEQGNIIPQENVGKIHRGMTFAEVKDILGNPVMVNVFDANRAEYVYTFQTGNEPLVEKHLTLIFKHGRVKEINDVTQAAL